MKRRAASFAPGHHHTSHRFYDALSPVGTDTTNSRTKTLNLNYMAIGFFLIKHTARRKFAIPDLDKTEATPLVFLNLFRISLHGNLRANLEPANHPYACHLADQFFCLRRSRSREFVQEVKAGSIDLTGLAGDSFN